MQVYVYCYKYCIKNTELSDQVYYAYSAVQFTVNIALVISVTCIISLNCDIPLQLLLIINASLVAVKTRSCSFLLHLPLQLPPSV